MEIRWNRPDMPKMNINEKHGVTWLTWPALEAVPGLLHGFTTRLGGISEGVCASMNLSFTRGDSESAVRENYRRIAEAMDFSAENIVTSDQTHTTNIRIVTEKDRGKGITSPRDYTDVDGMVTNVPGLVLATYYADCVPLYFADPVHRAIGLSHSGWRGTAGKIGAATVRTMQEQYGSDPADILAAIGPSICQTCYEVSADVIDQFRAAFTPQTWPSLFYQKANGKYQLNLWEANRLILLKAGLQPSHIHLPNLCTCCNPDFLFSHRASHGRRGNLAAFLELK